LGKGRYGLGVALERAYIAEFMTVAVRDQKRASRMLAEHPELRQARRAGESLLHYLAIENYVEGVRFLARNGFSVDQANEFGATPLSDAVQVGHLETTKVLLELGANHAVTERHTGYTPLERAVARGSPEMVEALLRAGADPNFEGGEQVRAALEFECVWHAREAVTALLVQHGFDPKG
jgi:ankyrin repeat protein